MKALGLPISKKKNFEFFFLCSNVLTCDPGTGPVLTPEVLYEQTWYRSTRRCYMPNIKALAVTVWDKKI